MPIPFPVFGFLNSTSYTEAARSYNQTDVKPNNNSTGVNSFFGSKRSMCLSVCQRAREEQGHSFIFEQQYSNPESSDIRATLQEQVDPYQQHKTTNLP